MEILLDLFYWEESVAKGKEIDIRSMYLAEPIIIINK